MAIAFTNSNPDPKTTMKANFKAVFEPIIKPSMKSSWDEKWLDWFVVTKKKEAEYDLVDQRIPGKVAINLVADTNYYFS